MDNTEIFRKAVQAHNCITGIPVSGDNVILMANAIVLLREIADALQKENGGAQSGE